MSMYDWHGPPGNNELDLLDEIFDRGGNIRRSYEKRLARERRRAYLRSWRPRFRVTVHVRLFPKTQRRLDALELELERMKKWVGWLQDDIRELQKESVNA